METLEAIHSSLLLGAQRDFTMCSCSARNKYDWMRDHLPDPDECCLEDTEEEGNTQSYLFLRHSDSATVVCKVAVKLEVYHDESSQEEPNEERWARQAEKGFETAPKQDFVAIDCLFSQLIPIYLIEPKSSDTTLHSSA